MFENSSAVSGLCWTVQTSMSLQHCILHTSRGSSHSHLTFQSTLDANLIQASDSHDQKYAVKHAALLLGPEFPYQGQRTAGRDSWSLSALAALLQAEVIKAQAAAKGWRMLADNPQVLAKTRQILVFCGPMQQQQYFILELQTKQSFPADVQGNHSPLSSMQPELPKRQAGSCLQEERGNSCSTKAYPRLPPCQA